MILLCESDWSLAASPVSSGSRRVRSRETTEGHNRSFRKETLMIRRSGLMAAGLLFATGLILFGPVLTFAEDGPLPPKEAAASIKLPPGFKATLFAGEPDVVQPMSMAFDNRGRMWVV
jgi:hypothetical protein